MKSEKETTIKIICCVCGHDIGSKDGMGGEGISHAYCKSCLAKAELDLIRDIPKDADNYREQVLHHIEEAKNIMAE